MKTFFRTAIVACAMVASAAFAGPGGGNGGGDGSAGTAAKEDVMLAGEAADDFFYSPGLNPQNGNTGSSGFDTAFGGSGTEPWEKIVKFTDSNGTTADYQDWTYNGLLTFTFSSSTDGLSGTWSITNTSGLNDVTMDLVFAMHVGGGSGAWLFDEQLISAGQTLNGTWEQNMLNNGGSVAQYSNLTFFGRDVRQVPIDDFPEVPEPATLASLALGLGMLGMMRRRKLQK